MIHSAIMGLVVMNEEVKYLGDIVCKRMVGSIHFGGRYRLIDFILSNMINAGIRNVGIIYGNKARSLMDHLRSGKEWDLDRKLEGLFLLPADGCNFSDFGPKSDLYAIHQHLDYLYTSRQEYVLIAHSNVVCNMDFRKVEEYHLYTGADITIVYTSEKNHSNGDFFHCTGLITDTDGRVTDMRGSPAENFSSKISADIYLLKKSLLISLLENSVSRGYRDFLTDVVLKNLPQLKVYGYQFPGYLARINSLKDYYTAHMALLRPEICRELFFRYGRIHTKVKNQSPTKYGTGAQVENSLVASGCVVEGTVQNSVLFRLVKIGKNARVTNCILLPEAQVQEGVELENVIMDKKAVVSFNQRIMGSPSFPVFVGKQMIV